MYNNIYKINNKNLAFFQIIGIIGTRYTFNYSFGLVNNERKEGFNWLIDQVNARREAIGAAKPLVIITDFDTAIRSAVKRVYPYTQSQLYIFYINKNVILNIKKL